MAEIRILAHNQRELFCLIGEYALSAAVRKELGGPLASDEQHTWFIAMDGDTVQGFAAVKVTPTGIGELKHCYVLPEYRQRGIGKQLTDSRLKYLESQNLRKIVSVIVPSRLRQFEKLGFENMGNRGQYIRMRKLL